MIQNFLKLLPFIRPVNVEFRYIFQSAPNALASKGTHPFSNLGPAECKEVFGSELDESLQCLGAKRIIGEPIPEIQGVLKSRSR
jgi:hypothetical protein